MVSVRTWSQKQRQTSEECIRFFWRVIMPRILSIIVIASMFLLQFLSTFSLDESSSEAQQTSMQKANANSNVLQTSLSHSTEQGRQVVNSRSTEHRERGVDDQTKLHSVEKQQSVKKPSFSRRDRILEACGELCDLSRPVRQPNPDFGYFGETTAETDCQKLFESPIVDEGHGGKPPRDIPEEFALDYGMNGRATIEKWYIKDVYLNKQAKQNVWREKQIEDFKRRALSGDFAGNYQVIDRSTLFYALDKIAKLEGRSVLVLGSETPWVEALCLAAKAKQVTTLEYGAITSYHPQVRTLTPNQFREMYLNRTLGTFDAVVSYSSLEHSGLGRYGDALNPFGDIMSLARAWCVTKPRGSLTLGLSSGPDLVYFNAARIYGPERWPYMTTNWVRVNYSAHWPDDVWKKAPDLKRADLRGPEGHKIFWNQSSLVFRKSGPKGSEHELVQSQKCPLLGC